MRTELATVLWRRVGVLLDPVLPQQKPLQLLPITSQRAEPLLRTNSAESGPRERPEIFRNMFTLAVLTKCISPGSCAEILALPCPQVPHKHFHLGHVSGGTAACISAGICRAPQATVSAKAKPGILSQREGDRQDAGSTWDALHVPCQHRNMKELERVLTPFSRI